MVSTAHETKRFCVVGAVGVPRERPERTRTPFAPGRIKTLNSLLQRPVVTNVLHLQDELIVVHLRPYAYLPAQKKRAHGYKT
eukprot:996193-Pleurochrysis_carterae.AAC.1